MLSPSPDLHFCERSHRYKFKDQWLLNSVTRVCNNLSDEARAQIFKTKDGPDGWEARGNAVHQAMEQMLLYRAGETKDGVVYDEQWAPWVETLMDHWLWEGCTVEAVELRLCDPKKSLGGSLDFIITDKDGQRVLGDVKTVKTDKAVDSRKPARAQLGGYTMMLVDSHRYWIDKCCTLVIGPNRAKLITDKPDDCLADWLDCWMKFDVLQPDF